jgi:hypothetical protein
MGVTVNIHTQCQPLKCYSCFVCKVCRKEVDIFGKKSVCIAIVNPSFVVYIHIKTIRLSNVCPYYFTPALH